WPPWSPPWPTSPPSATPVFHGIENRTGEAPVIRRLAHGSMAALAAISSGVAAAALCAAPLRTQDAAPAAPGHTRPITIAHAVRAAGPVELDGRLDERAWQSAPVMDSFTQINPDEG